jgi:hypothetical protein
VTGFVVVGKGFSDTREGAAAGGGEGYRRNGSYLKRSVSIREFLCSGHGWLDVSGDRPLHCRRAVRSRNELAQQLA